MATAEVADVLVVGAGAAGGVVAEAMASSGFDVVVLEQGDWVSQGDLPGLRPEYELMGASSWHPNPNIRRRSEDYPINMSDSDVTVGMFNGVGGSTILYAGCWVRALPSDFRVRTLDGVADDWPLTYRELEPFYRSVESALGVAGHPGNPAYPPGYTPPMPAHPINGIGRTMAEGMNRLGWHWWPAYNAVASQQYRHLRQCERLGVCFYGCPIGAKASLDLTLVPDAIASGAKLVTGARVARISVDSKGRATGAVYIKDGVEHFQPASLVVLAANGIGTPRLLLMSSSSQFPDGLANSTGLVGSRFMSHPLGTSVGIYDEDFGDYLGPSGAAIESMQFYETDESRGFVRGSKWHMMPTMPRPLGMIDRWTKGEGLEHEEFWGEHFAPHMKESVGHMIEWMLVPDDLPEESNSVTLDPDLVDSDGLPAPKIRYRTSDNTKRLMDFNLERSLEAHLAAGASRSWITSRNHESWHNLGTTKMGHDRKTSVVDSYGRAHDVPNLFVVDGSVFPTATGVNPTATICALARRTAEHLIETAPSQVVSS